MADLVGNHTCATAICAIISNASPRDLRGLLEEVGKAIDAREEALKNMEIARLRAENTTPLAAVVHTDVRDTKMGSVCIHPELASQLEDWQRKTKSSLWAVSLEHVRNHPQCFGGNDVQRPCSAAVIVRLPWQEGTTSRHDQPWAKWTEMGSLDGLGWTQRFYCDDKDGMVHAGDAKNDCYDMFVISVLEDVVSGRAFGWNYSRKRIRSDDEGEDGDDEDGEEDEDDEEDDDEEGEEDDDEPAEV